MASIRDLRSYLGANPIICLLLLSPGIPEYLSGSSPLNAIILNPFQFVFQIVANLGLYGPGVILIRESFVRWKKGWAGVLILGAAYGILEEGVGLSTLYNQHANPVGEVRFYGHAFGVNWIWAAGIIPVHMIFSISLPYSCSGSYFPRPAGRALLPEKESRVYLRYFRWTFLHCSCSSKRVNTFGWDGQYSWEVLLQSALSY